MILNTDEKELISTDIVKKTPVSQTAAAAWFSLFAWE